MLPDEVGSPQFFFQDMLDEQRGREGPCPCASAPQGSFLLDMVVWADDMLLFAAGELQAKAMVKILHEELQAIFLQFKPSSLEFLNIWDDDPSGEICRWNVAPGVDLPFKCVDKLNIQGNVFTAKCCYKTMADFRVSQAWVHFKAREAVFLDESLVQAPIAKIMPDSGPDVFIRSGDLGLLCCCAGCSGHLYSGYVAADVASGSSARRISGGVLA